MIGAQEINMNYCELSLYIFFTIVILVIILYCMYILLFIINFIVFY